MSDSRRVVVVKKRPIVEPVMRQEEFGRKARRTHARKAREEGKEYFSFCFNAEQFKIFAEKCVSLGKKPNEVIWSMIQKDMGWTE